MTDMPAAELLAAISEPLDAVVAQIAAVETTLSPERAREVVATVARSRNARRRLAQALIARPALLVYGRSPAPWVAGVLLRALRDAGAADISLPRCADCGNEMRHPSRRGQAEHWYCSGCRKNRREPYVVCGKRRRLAARDHDGHMRCPQCWPVEDSDPTSAIVEAVRRVDPTLASETVVTAVAAVTSNAGRRRQIAWALQDNPRLLTGEGAQGPKSVVRLVDALRAAGSERVIPASCVNCGRVGPLRALSDRGRICNRCDARRRVLPCSRCGRVDTPASRDESGQPICSNCWSYDAANQEICAGCGRRRPVTVRTPEGPRCEACRPKTMATCDICGRQSACETSWASGQRRCAPCRNRWTRCVRCGELGRVYGGSIDEPLCATCTRPDTAFWAQCPSCGRPQHGSRPCANCLVRQRLTELLGDNTGQVRPELHALRDNLAAHEQPQRVLAWLKRQATAGILADLGSGRRPLTHAALDELGGPLVPHLRSLLVASGALPSRDEYMVRLQRSVDHIIAGRTDPQERQLLQRYVVWHLLRRLRRRAGETDITRGQMHGIQGQIRSVIRLLDWLNARQLDLASVRQPDLEGWLTSAIKSDQRQAAHFLRWAAKQRLTTLRAPTNRWKSPAGVIDTEQRWEQARWLLHDETVSPEDRLAGLLVLLYGQYPATISRLTLDHIDVRDNEVKLRFGGQPIILPEPLDALTQHVVTTRHEQAKLGDLRPSRWLFSGGRPGQPITADRLAMRLRQIGLHPEQGRRAALFALAGELPAAVLAQMLGIHITCAVGWQKAAAGDWGNYSADLIERRSAPTASAVQTGSQQ
jgi:hypothetical protein